MLKKLLATTSLAALAFGWSAMAMPSGIPIEGDPDCSSCAPSVVLPTGTVCLLETCFSAGGGAPFCLYRCFFVLPPL